MQAVQAFINEHPEIKEDIEAKIAAGATTIDISEIKGIARDHGIDIPQLRSMDSEPNGALSDEALEGVNGGGAITIDIGGYTIKLTTPW